MIEMDDDSAEWPDPEDRAHATEQIVLLRDQAVEAGLRFEVYLPPSLALWLFDRIEQGRYVDPSEAAFVLIGKAREMEQHPDLRDELLKRSIQAAIDDPRPAIAGEEFFDQLRDKLKSPLPEPAKWESGPGAERRSFVTGRPSGHFSAMGKRIPFWAGAASAALPATI